MTAQLGMARMMLLFGIIATWVFISFTVGIASWMIAHPATPANAAANAEGPISWVYTLSMDTAGLNGINISALRFRGANISKKHIRLKEATITSLINGARIALEIVASDVKGDAKIVGIDKVELIPPGAPIEVLAKLGPPDPKTAGHVLGVDADTLLATWRQFAFEAADDTRSYRMEFNENVMMLFFQGKVGPRVAIRPEAQ